MIDLSEPVVSGTPLDLDADISDSRDASVGGHPVIVPPVQARHDNSYSPAAIAP